MGTSAPNRGVGGSRRHATERRRRADRGDGGVPRRRGRRQLGRFGGVLHRRELGWLERIELGRFVLGRQREPPGRRPDERRRRIARGSPQPGQRSAARGGRASGSPSEPREPGDRVRGSARKPSAGGRRRRRLPRVPGYYPPYYGGGYYGGYGGGYYPYWGYPWGWSGLYFYSPFWWGYGSPNFYDYGYGGYGYGGYGGGGGGYYYGAAEDYMQGALKLKVKPREAEVMVDGYFVGRVDDFDGAFQELKLKPGTHHVEIRAQGFEPISFDVQVDPRQSITYRGDLKALK